jgi:hypothetical protein
MKERRSRRRGRRRRLRSRLNNNAEQQRERLLNRPKQPNRLRGNPPKYLVSRTSVRNDLGVVHQRLQPQKLPHHPPPEFLHEVAASLYPRNLDSTN